MRLRIRPSAAAWRAVVRYFFLAVAIICLGLYGYAYLKRALYQTYESREFNRTGRDGGSFGASPGLPSPEALLGRLSIPRLHLSAMVREGIDGDTLQVAIGHVPATALPGQAGNVAVAGHRDTFFRGLKDLRAGDEVHFATLSGDFEYVVESLRVVEPDDVGVLAPTSENALTLVTCYPFSYVGAAPKRFVVRARQSLPQTAALRIVK